jgi:hypothetical protein
MKNTKRLAQPTTWRRSAAALLLACTVGAAQADLTLAGTFSGNVGLSVDGVGGNNAAVGTVQAVIPVGATILKAFLYSAGTPSARYFDSPTSLAAYNSSGITLAGNTINNFTKIVGATSELAGIGRWFTGRADVTSLIQTLTAGAATDSFSWAVTEGALNNRIDGEVLAIVYSHPSLALATVALLDGGQRTSGESTVVNFTNPLTDPTVAGFAAQFGIASSFSAGGQASTISVNGSELTRFAGNNDDGTQAADGSLITVGGIGDDPSNNVADYADDDELYTLKPFLKQGDTSFTIRTSNATNDDNIFFAHLYVTAQVKDINGDPGNGVPEPQSAALVLAALAAARAAMKKRKAT